MPKPICTLIHFSDPHFGSSFVIDGESWWRNLVAHSPGLRHISALFPHSYQRAVALAHSIRRILADRRDLGIPTVVVHTGDLTASGAASEFSVGATFLSHGHYLANGTLAGLKLDPPAFDLPGNHDLWSRKSPRALEAFTSHYGGAYPRSLTIERNGHKVTLHSLDSNRSDLVQHRLARGAIAAEALHEVCERLRKNRPATQVVCLHHPLYLSEEAKPRLFGFEILDLKNRTGIEAALAEAGANLVLAGHVHTQHAHERNPVQFIAGSACQIGSHPPAFWLLDLHADEVAFTQMAIPRNAFQFVDSPIKSGSFANPKD